MQSDVSVYGIAVRLNCNSNANGKKECSHNPSTLCHMCTKTLYQTNLPHIHGWHCNMVTNSQRTHHKCHDYPTGLAGPQTVSEPEEVQTILLRNLFPWTPHLGKRHQSRWRKGRLYQEMANPIMHKARPLIPWISMYLTAFLPNLAQHTNVLDKLTTKECDKVFLPWSEHHQKAFDNIKELVLSKACLTTINPLLMPLYKIFVTMDASDTGSGAVLSFSPSYKTARPMAYDSCAFKGAELNYPIHKKELLTIIRALAKWHTDLLGYKFKVWTDHQTLEHYGTQHNLSCQQARWMEFMSHYNAMIHYIPGEKNCTADTLSRLSDPPLRTIASMMNTSQPNKIWSCFELGGHKEWVQHRSVHWETNKCHDRNVKHPASKWILACEQPSTYPQCTQLMWITLLDHPWQNGPLWHAEDIQNPLCIVLLAKHAKGPQVSIHPSVHRVPVKQVNNYKANWPSTPSTCPVMHDLNTWTYSSFLCSLSWYSPCYRFGLLFHDSYSLTQALLLWLILGYVS